MDAVDALIADPALGTPENLDQTYAEIVTQLSAMSEFQLQMLFIKMHVGALEDEPGADFTAGDLVDELIELERRPVSTGAYRKGRQQPRATKGNITRSHKQAIRAAISDFAWGVGLCARL